MKAGKRVLLTLLGIFTGFLFSPFSMAESTSAGPVTIAARVPAGLTLELTIVDQLTRTERPSLDFGELVRVGEEFRSTTFFKVLLKINTVGDSCELTQTGTPLTRSPGGETIPDGAYFVRPAYDEADNNDAPQPPGSGLGVAGAVVGPRVLYRDPTGSSRVIAATYTLSGDPNTGATEIIPLSQKSGSYSGTVQFTLTTV